MYFGFKDITIKYGEKEIINNLTVEFEKGKIATIIGQNGCGKTSLLKTVSRAVEPVSGEVIFENLSINKYKPKELAKKVAYLPQVHFSPPDIDVYTLISYGRFPYRKFGSSFSVEDNRIIEETIKLTELEKLKHRSLSSLSGGERQRAWIAMTICQQPDILILDEPITYLDVGFQIEVLELIKYLGKKLNITIIMVLHDINLAARYSDVMYALKDCSLLKKGSPREVLTEEILKELFNIKVQIFNDEINDCPFFIPDKI